MTPKPVLLILTLSFIVLLAHACDVSRTRPHCLCKSRANLTCTEVKSIKSHLKAATRALGGTTNHLYWTWIIKYVFYDAAEYDRNNYDYNRVDGCINVNDPMYLYIKREDDLFFQEATFDTLWEGYCKDLSRSDFYVLLATIHIEILVEAGNEDVRLSIPVSLGREDRHDCSYREWNELGLSRLPDVRLGFSEIERVLMHQMGLSLEESVILTAAHDMSKYTSETDSDCQLCPSPDCASSFGLGMLNELLSNIWYASPDSSCMNDKLGNLPRVPLFSNGKSVRFNTIGLYADWSIALTPVEMTMVFDADPADIKGHCSPIALATQGSQHVLA